MRRSWILTQRLKHGEYPDTPLSGTAGYPRDREPPSQHRCSPSRACTGPGTARVRRQIDVAGSRHRTRTHTECRDRTTSAGIARRTHIGTSVASVLARCRVLGVAPLLAGRGSEGAVVAGGASNLVMRSWSVFSTVVTFGVLAVAVVVVVALGGRVLACIWFGLTETARLLLTPATLGATLAVILQLRA